MVPIRLLQTQLPVPKLRLRKTPTHPAISRDRETERTVRDSPESLGRTRQTEKDRMAMADLEVLVEMEVLVARVADSLLRPPTPQ